MHCSELLFVKFFRLCLRQSGQGPKKGAGGGGLLEILGGGMSPSSQNPDPISEKPISNSHIFAFFLTHLEFKR